MNFHQRQNHEADTTQQSRQESDPLEFQSAEEMLRYDAAHVEIPGNIADRIAESAEGMPPLPWWKRLFHG